MSEYLAQLGRRTELRQAALQQKIKAKSHLESLRLALDPLAEIGDLPAEKILSLAGLLAEAITDLQETQAKIKAINDLIGQG